MDLIIVRHGLPEREVRADGEGGADPVLSDLGRRQAEATAAFLAAEGIDHIVASPMQRAHQTARPLSTLLELPIELHEGLMEVDRHSSSYIPAEELTEDDEAYQMFVHDPLAIFDEQGGLEVFQANVVSAMEHVIATNRSKTVAVFCHGMVMGVYLRSIVGHADPYALSPDYCGLMRVRASSAGTRSVLSMNETAHVRDVT